MQTIDDDELDAQLRQGADLQLLRVCDSGGPGSIPGSLILPPGIEPAHVLDADRRTVIYGCVQGCEPAVRTVTRLATDGFRDVRLYPAGIDGWRRAARPVEH